MSNQQRAISNYKERPILFSSAMVNAILEGRKTQTRRVITQINKCKEFIDQAHNLKTAQEMLNTFPTSANAYAVFCPYGFSGNRIWVRETFAYGGIFEGKDVRFVYACDPHGIPFDGRWTPSIYMPRSASRITLEITNIRVERVQDISEEDAVAEGCFNYAIKQTPQGYIGFSEKYKAWRLPQVEFQDLWDSINFKRGYGWNVNPWVWVIEFKKV